MDQATLAWSAVMIIGFAGSALFSGLETGVYSLNRIRLQIFAHQQRRSARTLRRLLDQRTRLLTTLLIGNNVANYAGAAALAVILEHAGFNDWQTIVLNTLIVTPLLFVFGETLPKDLYAAHADRFTYPFAGFLVWLQRVFTWLGVQPLIVGLSNLTMRLLRMPGPAKPFHPRRHVEALVKESVGYGLISEEQSALAERVLELSARRVRDEMVPWSRVVKIGVNEPAERIRALASEVAYSRVPVVDESGQVLGILNLFDALLQPSGEATIRELMQPATTVPVNAASRTALKQMQAKHAALAIVTGAHDRPVGIVTVKDLIEPITGELVNW